MRVNLSVQRGRRASIFLSSSLRPLEINSRTHLGALHATLGSRWVFHKFFFLSLLPLTLLVTGCSEWPGNRWETSCFLLLLLLLASLKNIHWAASAVRRWAAVWKQCFAELGAHCVINRCVLLNLLKTRTAWRGDFFMQNCFNSSKNNQTSEFYYFFPLSA